MAEAFQHVRYIIEIKRIGRRTVSEVKEFCTSQEPTEIKARSSYGNGEDIGYRKTFEVREVPKVETVEQSIFRQEVDDLNLVNVIAAVNEIEHVTIKETT